MKKLMPLLFLLCTQTQAQDWAKITTAVTCGPFQDIVKVLTQEKYNELPLWVGQSEEDRSKFILFLNADQGNFTILQYYKDRACLLGAGKTSDIVNLAPFTQKH